jgi:hypothetical protein
MHTSSTPSAKNRIASIIAVYRASQEIRNNGEAEHIARELGLSLSDLHTLAGKGAGAAALLDKRMTLLGLNSDDLARAGIATERDLQRTCTLCDQHRRCARDLNSQDRSDCWLDYCPNTYTLLAMRKARREHTS